MNVYIISQLFSKNKMSIKEIMTFPWEKDSLEEHKTSISNEEIEQLKLMAEQIRKKNYG
jgi:hypothetical protein